jgi:hypothetical protein
MLKAGNGYVTIEEIILQRGSKGRNNMVENGGLGGTINKGSTTY